MTDPNGDQLLAGLAAGRDEAFAALYARDGPALFRVALAVIGSRADAEDAVQDVFVALAQAGPALLAVGNLRAYLFTALRHAAAKAAMRRRVERWVPHADLATVPAPQERPLALDAAARLEVALARLPSAHRELIALKVDGGLTFREIAAVLGIGPNTAASRYRAALSELRDTLGTIRDG